MGLLGKAQRFQIYWGWLHKIEIQGSAGGLQGPSCDMAMYFHIEVKPDVDISQVAQIQFLPLPGI